MTNYLNAAFAHKGDTFDVTCDACGKTNRVHVVQQDGHNEREEYDCAGCGAELGKVRASLPPRTTLI